MSNDGDEAARLDAVPKGVEECRAQVLEGMLASWARGNAEWSVSGRGELEVERFRSGVGASLPFLTRSTVAWVTVAPTASALHREIGLLRAWVLPSFGWEDGRNPFVVPGEEAGRLSSSLMVLSPAGYFRWLCKHQDYEAVLDRLARMRALIVRKPEHVLERPPGLLELRQQFRTALLTGMREAAESAIQGIDHYQLDTAVNTQLMRLRMLDQFRDYSAIVGDPSINRILGVRLPRGIQCALIRAYHALYVAVQEEVSAEAAAQAYRDQVHEVIGGLLLQAMPQDGPEIARMLAYRAWTMSDSTAAKELLSSVEASVLPLLGQVVNQGPAAGRAETLAHRFEEAVRRGDLRVLQSLAPSLMASIRESPNTALNAFDPIGALSGSLDILPNQPLARQLAETRDGPAVSPIMPQSWTEVLARLRARDVEAAERFLALDDGDRPRPEQLSAVEREGALGTLEELLTDPVFDSSGRRQWVANIALPAFIEDFVSEPGFPRTDLLPVYLQLLRLWVEHKCGSAYAPDGQLLLMLAAAVLQFGRGNEDEVSSSLVRWWRGRPVPAALPFLVEALDIVVDFTVAGGLAHGLWLEGVNLLARGTVPLSPTERALWRRLGVRTGLDAPSLDAVLPEVAASAHGHSLPDPIRALGLRKIAIVSLHRRSAEEASEVLYERTGAEVVVVDEMVPGPATRAAQGADAVLFVWAATKHAVFRAFDTVRDRVVYVQGTGAASILLAFERWAMRNIER